MRVDNPAAQALYRELGFETIVGAQAVLQAGGVDAMSMKLVVPIADDAAACVDQ